MSERLAGNATTTVSGGAISFETGTTVEMPPHAVEEGKSRRVPMRPVEVIELCDCGADLPPPRQGLTMGLSGTSWQHWCAACQKSVWRRRDSGRIEYEPAHPGGQDAD